MKHPIPLRLAATTEKHLSAYALAMTAGVGALMAAQMAEADILPFNTGSFSSSPNAGQASFPLLNGGGGPTLDLSHGSGSFSGVHSSVALAGVGGAGTHPVVAGSRQASYAGNLAKGSLIGGLRTFRNGSGSADAIGFRFASTNDVLNRGYFHGAGPGYLGIKFTDPSNPSQTDYGWVQISENDNQMSIDILSGAYDNTGAPILAGQTVVTEPGSLALLALGGAGLLAWRKRRALSAAAPTLPA